VALVSTDRAVEKLADRFQDYENIAQGFVGDLISGAEAGHSAIEALSDAFANLGDQLLRMAANQAIKSIFAALTGGPIAAGAGIAGGVLGFAGGGQVKGPGTSTSDSIPAMLSDGEHVIRASEARKHRALLNAINDGRLGHFADGGVVGGGVAPLASGAIGGQVINVAPSINVSVEGGSRGPEADAALAATIGKEIDDRIRGIISQEVMRAGRPGNLLNNRQR
jgi:hypothetical protein